MLRMTSGTCVAPSRSLMASSALRSQAGIASRSDYKCDCSAVAASHLSRDRTLSLTELDYLMRVSRQIDSVLQVVGLALLLGLSLQLTRVKRRVASLRAQIAAGTSAFISGRQVPEIPVRTATGQQSLNTFCRPEKPAVLLVTAPQCEACARLRPLWRHLVLTRSDLRFVHVEVGTPDSIPTTGSGASDGDNVYAPAALMNAALHINTVPAAAVTNEACSFGSAGAGADPAKAVLTELLPETERPQWTRVTLRDP